MLIPKGLILIITIERVLFHNNSFTKGLFRCKSYRQGKIREKGVIPEFLGLFRETEVIPVFRGYSVKITELPQQNSPGFGITPVLLYFDKKILSSLCFISKILKGTIYTLKTKDN